MRTGGGDAPSPVRARRRRHAARTGIDLGEAHPHGPGLFSFPHRTACRRRGRPTLPGRRAPRRSRRDGCRCRMRPPPGEEVWDVHDQAHQVHRVDHRCGWRRHRRGGGRAVSFSPSTSRTTAPTTTTSPPTTTMAATTSTRSPSRACLARSSVVDLSGSQERVDGSPFKFRSGSTIDARTAYWNQADSYPLAIRDAGVGTRLDPCLVGGNITTPYPDTDPWERWHGRAGVQIDEPGSQVIGTTVSVEGDGIQYTRRAASWSIVGVHESDIHDDCIEDDGMQSGLVSDSLFDGCFNFLSAQGFSGYTYDGSGNQVTVQNSLVRLGDFTSVSQGPSPGHAFFFKWGQDPPELVPSNTTGHAPELAIKNTIFMADSDTAISGHQGIGMPQSQDAAGNWHDYVTDCSHNTMVWLAAGPYPETLPSCFHVTTDRSVGDRTRGGVAGDAPGHSRSADPTLTSMLTRSTSTQPTTRMSVSGLWSASLALRSPGDQVALAQRLDGEVEAGRGDLGPHLVGSVAGAQRVAEVLDEHVGLARPRPRRARRAWPRPGAGAGRPRRSRRPARHIGPRWSRARPDRPGGAARSSTRRGRTSGSRASGSGSRCSSSCTRSASPASRSRARPWTSIGSDPSTPRMRAFGRAWARRVVTSAGPQPRSSTSSDSRSASAPN